MRRAALVDLGGGGRAALLFVIAGVLMGTFSYGPSQSPPTINPPIDYVRGLISDTQEFDTDGVTPIYIFSDQEIQMFTQMQPAFAWQSAQFYSPPAGAFPAAQPTPYLRIAATMLNSIASNKARLSSVLKVLDVQLDASKAAQALRDTADKYLEMDDNSGAFAIVEMVNDSFSFRDRYWKQVQRQQGI